MGEKGRGLNRRRRAMLSLVENVVDPAMSIAAVFIGESSLCLPSPLILQANDGELNATYTKDLLVASSSQNINPSFQPDPSLLHGTRSDRPAITIESYYNKIHCQFMNIIWLTCAVQSTVSKPLIRSEEMTNKSHTKEISVLPKKTRDFLHQLKTLLSRCSICLSLPIRG